MTDWQAGMTDWQPLFYELLTAEAEADVLDVLEQWNLLSRENWRFLGNTENNFSTIGNQHSDPTGAFVEKIINAVDAKLLAAAFTRGIETEGPSAPGSMAAAVEEFFQIPDGKLGDLSRQRQRELADGIQVVAVGKKEAPSYLIADDGEGQTPRSFPDTFMSLAKSNKMRIPFVQGKFNSGGTGVLQFCGNENLQLIASRRHPSAPVDKNDPTGDDWGFSIVRRLEPQEGESRRNSIYVYLAPGGDVPSFSAPEVFALPGDSRQNQPATPYARPLTHGTVVKLYNYRWKARSMATTEARFELEKYLHAPALPFRVTETRAYRANYYSTTVAGVWAIPTEGGDEDRPRVEDGFPTTGTLNAPLVGDLTYKILVFTEDVKARRIPTGVVFAINGQVHGELPNDFVSRRLEFEYLRKHLLVSVDCTHMRTRTREDFFPAARDRVRRNEAYDEIVDRLARDLKAHPGLKALNAARRTQVLRKALSDEDDVIKTLTSLLNTDPALRALFSVGDRLVTRVGPSETEVFKGRRFPSYFRLMRDPKQLVKHCPQNRTCRRMSGSSWNFVGDLRGFDGQTVTGSATS